MSKHEEYQAKVNNYYKLYTDATLRIASNPQEWLKFIRTSCKNYKCDFRLFLDLKKQFLLLDLHF